jgi:hypothetical protein
MTKAELIKALEPYPDDMPVCGTVEWEFEIGLVNKRVFSDRFSEDDNKKIFGKECIFLT